MRPGKPDETRPLSPGKVVAGEGPEDQTLGMVFATSSRLPPSGGPGASIVRHSHREWWVRYRTTANSR